MIYSAVVTLCVSFISDFVVSGGGALMAVMVVNDTAQLPTKAAWIVAGVTGLIAGARRVQALIAPSVTNGGLR